MLSWIPASSVNVIVTSSVRAVGSEIVIVTSLLSANVTPLPDISRNPTYKIPSATFVVSDCVDADSAFTLSVVTPSGTVIAIVKLLRAPSVPDAVALTVIVLLSLEIDDVRPIPLPTTGTSVGTGVTSGEHCEYHCQSTNQRNDFFVLHSNLLLLSYLIFYTR